MRFSIVAALIIGALLSPVFQTPVNIAPSTVVDVSQALTSFGQYGLLVWLIITQQKSRDELQRAWREERRWMIEKLAIEPLTAKPHPVRAVKFTGERR